MGLRRYPHERNLNIDTIETKSQFDQRLMADNNPNVPPGAGATPPAPPKAHESGKIQPKKETVRINLPPKPTAAPTIKIPAPSAVHAAAPAATAAAAPAAPVAATAAPRAAAAPPPPPAAAAAPRPAAAAAAASAPAPARPAPAPVYTTGGYDTVDKVLAIAAAVVALAALVRVVTL